MRVRHRAFPHRTENTKMVRSFEESVRQAQTETVETLAEGDTCPEDHCDRELHELHHPRESQIPGIPRHPDAPETEVVCVHDGIVATR